MGHTFLTCFIWFCILFCVLVPFYQSYSTYIWIRKISRFEFILKKIKIEASTLLRINVLNATFLSEAYLPDFDSLRYRNVETRAVIIIATLSLCVSLHNKCPLLHLPILTAKPTLRCFAKCEVGLSVLHFFPEQLMF